jgi:hypothetical protein
MPDSADIANLAISPSRDWEHQTWALPGAWEDINGVVTYLLNHHEHAQKHLQRDAARIDALLQLMNPLLDRLCRHTCTFCPEPCCARAIVWYDIKDLLFLHLSLQPRPSVQPLAHGEPVCRYLGIRGCRLPRRRRPWICTHYLCPAQKKRLRRLAPSRLTLFDTVLERIKRIRRGMLAAFDQAQSVDRLLQAQFTVAIVPGMGLAPKR